MLNSLKSVLKMVIPIVSLILIGCAGDGGIDTATTLLGTSEYDGAQGIAVDKSGNIYITGWTLGNLDGNTNAGVDDAFLAKFDSSGVRQWTRLLGSPGDDLAFGVAVDGSGNIYIAGRTRGDLDGNHGSGGWDAFLTKYDSSGRKLWTRLLGSPGDEGAHDVAVDGSGNIYIAGIAESHDGLDGCLSAGSSDAFLAKYDSSGNRQWTRLLGSLGDDDANSVAVDSSGNVYITGYTSGDLDGNTNAGGDDVFLTKFDSAGIKQWTRLLGTSEEDHSRGITVDGGGNIYITGYTSGDLDGNTNAGYHDAFLAKFDSARGIKQWTRLLGSSREDLAFGVAVDGNGNIYLTGETSGSLDGNPNAGGYYDKFFAKYDSSGNKQWTTVLGSPGDDEANGIAVDSGGNIYIAGITDGNLGGNINAGNYDVFLFRYSPDV